MFPFLGTLKQVRVQLESCRLTNVSFAAIGGLPECPGMACEDMRWAKRPSLFLAARPNESNLTDRPGEPVNHFSRLRQHSCWANGKTHVEFAASEQHQKRGRAKLRYNPQCAAKSYCPNGEKYFDKQQIRA